MGHDKILAREILEQMEEAFALLDYDFRVLDLNRAALKIDPRSREELIGSSIWELSPGLEETEFARLIKTAMQDRKAVQTNFENNLPGGDSVWLEVRLFPVEGGLGLLYRDVTSTRLAEHTLQASEEFNRQILKSSTDCIKVLSLDGHLQFMSEGGQQVMEVDDFSLLKGRLWRDLWPTGERHKIDAAINEASKGRPSRFRGAANTAKGNQRWWDVAVSAIYGADGKPETLLSISRDITPTQLAERDLDETRRRLDAILNNTTMAVFLMDENQECVFANTAAENLTGYEFEDMQGRPLHDVVHHKKPDGSHYPLEECPIDRAFPERAQMQGEELFVAPDGSFYPVSFTASPVLDDDGKPIGTVIEARNVEEERQRDWALTETIERYRLVAKATRDAVWDWDFATNLVQWNDAVQELFGYTPGQVGAGADWWAATIHPDDRERVETSIHDVIEGTGSGWTDEYRFRRADGTFAHVLDRGYVIRNEAGTAVRMIGAMLDLTDLRRSEALLRQSHERFQTAVSAVESIVWTNDPEGRMLGEQASWANLTGQSYDEYQGYGWSAAVHPDDAKPTIAAWEKAVASKTMFVFEHRLRRGDGEWRTFAIRAVPWLDEDGEIREWVGVHTDVTQQRAAEQALRELNETLEQRVAAEVLEREAAQDALRQAQKMEAVGQLTGGIAHDFNNLLTVVMGNVNLALRSVQTSGGDPRLERILSGAQRGAERAASLTQRLLAFSRRQPLAPKPINVDKLVGGMSDLLYRSLGEMVKLEVISMPGLWRTEADPHQLEAALLNLAVNARDAMPMGGKLTIETSNAQLNDSYTMRHAEVASGPYVCIAVTDTGEGMAREMLDKVFEPFFTTKEVGKGTGLGLSMVYGFIKQSGGHVKLYSEIGEGTTVRMYFPRLMHDAEPEEDTIPDGGLETSRSGETILVVEDDDDVRSYTVDILRELGYRVLEAHDGPSALRLLARQSTPVDLLFTDVVMPDMSGSELATQAQLRQPELRVLFTSGYTRNAMLHGGRLESGVDFVAKPFTAEHLAQRLRDALDRGRTGRALLVETDPAVRAKISETLASMGYATEEGARTAEALSKIRSMTGHYNILIFDCSHVDRNAVAFYNELRAMHRYLPIMITNEAGAEISGDLAKDDSCAIVLDEAVSREGLRNALNELRVRCQGAVSEN
ncbi:MAG: PAS domain S-box protein [Pseudomonadota bacterium]|nr:PAS domain S-box protein [Pseudomonadota bacterium]